LLSSVVATFSENTMELLTHKKFKSGKLMPWGKGTVVSGAKGMVYLKGPFPDGGVLSSPNYRLDALDEFFAEHCPKHCSSNNPPPSEVIGVAALAQPDIVIEIVAVAALPD
jgi:hypothetical protein